MSCGRLEKVLSLDESYFLFKGSTADMSGAGRMSSYVLPISMR